MKIKSKILAVLVMFILLTTIQISSAQTWTRMEMIFARGTDGALWFRNYDGDHQTWTSLGGQITSDPDAVSCMNNHVDVFARGTDNALWQKSADISIYGGIAWSDWKYLGGILKSGPGALKGSPLCNISVYVRGIDDALWYRKYDGTSWKNWQSAGGIITSDPDGEGDQYSNLVVVRGLNNDIWTYTTNGDYWKSLGGVSSSGPATTALDIFTRGTDNALWVRLYNFNIGDWLDWQSEGGIITSDPDASSYYPLEYIVSRGTDNAVWMKKYNYVTETWNPWIPLGGIIASGPSIVTIMNGG